METVIMYVTQTVCKQHGQCSITLFVFTQKILDVLLRSKVHYTETKNHNIFYSFFSYQLRQLHTLPSAFFLIHQHKKKEKRKWMGIYNYWCVDIFA